MRSPGFLGGAVADTDYAHRLIARETVVIHYQDVETETVKVGRCDFETERLVEDWHQRVAFYRRFPLVLPFPVVELIYFDVGTLGGRE